ncbi:hypothetical protein EDB89DRAFT_1914300 [Lactarius sanguifluus]|nr:hypothetical protein EDB89DRAFT_1914300 [Lactarius sanguifluus]
MPNTSSARPAAGTMNHGRRPAGGRDVNELPSNECTRECDSFVTSTRAREYSFPRVHASTSFHFRSREYSWYSRGHPSESFVAGMSHCSVINWSWSSLVVLLAIAPAFGAGRWLEFMQPEAASANLRRVVVVCRCRPRCFPRSTFYYDNDKPRQHMSCPKHDDDGHPNDYESTTQRAAAATTTTQRRWFNHTGNDSKTSSNNNAIDINGKRRHEGKLKRR